MSCTSVEAGYWAPIGSARFMTLIRRGFYRNIQLWRVNGAIVQFGAEEKDAKPGMLCSCAQSRGHIVVR